MSVVAAVDVGTNSARLLISNDGSDVLRRMEIVRLGQGVDRSGRLDPAAIERTRRALESFAADIAAYAAVGVRLVATSATRDAANRSEFVDMVRQTLGVEPEVVTGEAEAALSYAGATSGADLHYPVLVADIGGGSTECILGDRPGQLRAARSVDIGCVRLTERRLVDDPPTAAQVQAARADIEAAFDTVEQTLPLTGAASLVGLAGSVTTVAAYALDLPRYDASRIHGARLPVADAQRACRDLLAMTRDKRAALPFMHPGRVDVIGGGALVLAVLLERSQVATLTVSEHDILDGIAASIAGVGQDGLAPRLEDER